MLLRQFVLHATDKLVDFNFLFKHRSKGMKNCLKLVKYLSFFCIFAKKKPYEG